MNSMMAHHGSSSPALVSAMSDSTEIQTYEHWKNTEGRKIHPVFGEQTEYDAQRAIFRKRPGHRLAVILKEAGKLDPDNNSQDCSWEYVFQHIESAEKTYEEKAGKNKIRGYLRKGKADAQLMSSLLSFIPDENGLGILREGLSLIFRTWLQRIQNQEQVIETFGDIIETFSTISNNAAVYLDDVLLGNLISDLYGVTLDSLEGLINILLRTHQGSWVRRLRKQLPDHETYHIEEILHHLNNTHQKVESRMGTLGAQRQVEIHRATGAIHREVQATRLGVSSVAVNVKEIGTSVTCMEQNVMEILTVDKELSVQVEGVNDNVRNMGQSMELAFTRAVSQGIQELKKHIGENTMQLGPQARMSYEEIAQSCLYRLVAESSSNPTVSPMGQMISQQQCQQHTPQQVVSNYQPLPITMEYLLQILNANPLSLVQNAEFVLRKSHSMKRLGLVKARWLLHRPQFQNWLARPRPNVLLVDGHCKADGIGKVSPLSVLCASLVPAVARSAHCIVLHHFCSQHNDPGLSSISGPAGLLRSLIAQLIAYPGTPLSDVDCGRQEIINAIAGWDTTTLCHLFSKLISRIEASRTIFCIIDSISDFETNFRGWDKELMNVVRLLRVITDVPRPGPPMKILLTNANKTLMLRPFVNEHVGEYVALRAGHTNDPSVSGRAFDNDIQRILAPPANSS